MLNFLNNMSKTTTDVIGAIIAVIIFWIAVQLITGGEIGVVDKHMNEIETTKAESKKP